MSLGGQLKGTYLGICRRTVCQQTATWFNPNMRNDPKGPAHAHYCRECALLLNKENKHHEFWKLCYQGEEKRT